MHGEEETQTDTPWRESVASTTWPALLTSVRGSNMPSAAWHVGPCSILVIKTAHACCPRLCMRRRPGVQLGTSSKPPPPLALRLSGRNMHILARQRPPAYADYMEWQQQHQQVCSGTGPLAYAQHLSTSVRVCILAEVGMDMKCHSCCARYQCNSCFNVL